MPARSPGQSVRETACAVFRNNYLEILGVVDPGRWACITREQRGPFDLDAPLQRYEGLHVLHLGAEDLEAVHSRLRSTSSPRQMFSLHGPVSTNRGGIGEEAEAEMTRSRMSLGL